ncbi:glycerophosphodiester phosphodiesterase GDPDL7 [Tripterygium wilfordii]|uniref:glycerophosphodiester phosphodiesterase GDPDL7 n=1 Tax=Tripterygium wilfordii TaxID=458696 RepID=UPI0018F844E2|nr:glycerophosphodiester phosphodiesterase GDPDL7 [Tripterygium wilfordii]
MIRFFFLFSLLLHATLAKKAAPAGPSEKWLTLSGKPPLVIARGGLSGIAPESSQIANTMAISTTAGSTSPAIFCNLQLTKDGMGICQTDIRLDNSTTIAQVYGLKEQKTYKVNGENVHGSFALDYILDELYSNVTLMQNIMSRPDVFDGLLPISSVDDVAGTKPPQLWLNVQYDRFYTEHKLSMASFIQETTRLTGVNYISSPEIGFLKSMNGKVNKARTKLIFTVLGPDVLEPTTNQKYGVIIKDLATVKSFASGILVPKGYIWPVNKQNYLEAVPTTLVTDAHKEGLEVYASGFANDMPASYNYSYDPSAEYLQFIANSQFSVDGVLTDFPPTAAQAIACFAQMGNGTTTRKGQPYLIITHNGASGVYPGSTDLAYQQAVNDGADIIDCTVQLSKDGVAFCSDTADLAGDTTAMSSFMARATTIPEIQAKSGVFSFDLEWSEIQTLKPQLASPFETTQNLVRNPAAKNAGKLVTLAEFLDLAKTKAVSGIMIDIQNAAYLASHKGLDIVAVVTSALSNATFDKQSTQQVLIQSDDTSVLSKFKEDPTYKRVLSIAELKGDAPKQSVDEIKKFADAVNVPRGTLLVTTEDGFTKSTTNVVKEMKAANISVYVSVLMNEFPTLAFDFFSDPIIELASFIQGLEVNGIVTEYPATASRYLGSPCSEPNAKTAFLMSPIGGLLSTVESRMQAPAAAPAPPIEVADIVDPPLPPVTKSSTPDGAGAGAGSNVTPAPGPRSSGFAGNANVGLSLLAIAVLSFFSIGYYL